MIEHTDNTHNKETVHIVSAEEAKTIIAHRLNGLESSQRMCRIEVEIEKQDILKWLDSQDAETRFYFSGRDAADSETAGIGIADSVYCNESLDHKSTFGHMRKHLNPEIPNLKYYGGFAFAPGHIDAEWQSFGPCRFIIPRFQLLTNQNSTTLACNVLIDKEKPKDLDRVLHELEQLNFTGYREFSKPGKLLSRTDTPDYDQWRTNLTRVIDEIKNRQYNKTVLARKVELHFENTLDPIAILASLKRLPSNRYDFMFQFDGKNAFVGSSPERLYKRTGRAIQSEALAGTRSRGEKEKDDLRQAKELINSNKEQREHDFVVHTVKRELKPLCSSLETDEQKSLL
ncbi:MAG: hypothetical protein GY950_33100, partial [bacterium]|nr:hypothetical protein [bacterium]